MNRRRRRSEEPLTLSRIYSVPDPHDTHEEAQRFHHRDLAQFATAELKREGERVRLRLLLEDDDSSWDSEWFAGRLRRIEAALRARRA